MLVNSLLTLVFGRSSERWPTTTALIVSSEIQTGMLRAGTQVYWASLSYEYKVNDHKYTGSRVGFSKYGVASNNSTKREVAEAIVEQYPQGSEVEVHYLSNMPSFSTLESGFRTIGFAGHFFLGSVLTTSSIYMAVVLYIRVS